MIRCCPQKLESQCCARERGPRLYGGGRWQTLTEGSEIEANVTETRRLQRPNGMLMKQQDFVPCQHSKSYTNRLILFSNRIGAIPNRESAAACLDSSKRTSPQSITLPLSLQFHYLFKVSHTPCVEHTHGAHRHGRLRTYRGSSSVPLMKRGMIDCRSAPRLALDELLSRLVERVQTAVLARAEVARQRTEQLCSLNESFFRLLGRVQAVVTLFILVARFLEDQLNTVFRLRLQILGVSKEYRATASLWRESHGLIPMQITHGI